MLQQNQTRVSYFGQGATTGCDRESDRFSGSSSGSYSNNSFNGSEGPHEPMVSYTEFNDLSPIPEGTDLNALLDRIKQGFDSNSWKETFQSIDHLRALNKSFPREINVLFQAFGVYIEKVLRSSKPCIAKNVLAFVHEVLTQADTSGLMKTISSQLAVLLITKAAHSTKTVRVLCEKSLDTLVKKCLCDETLQVLSQNAISRDKVANKIAFHYLTLGLDIIKENLSQVNKETLRILFQSLAHVLEADCAQSKSLAKKILVYIRGLMGETNFMNYVHLLYSHSALSYQHAEKVVAAAESKLKIRHSLANALAERQSVDPYFFFRKREVFLEINRQSYCL